MQPPDDSFQIPWNSSWNIQNSLQILSNIKGNVEEEIMVITLTSVDRPFKWTHFLRFPQQNLYQTHLHFICSTCFIQQFHFYSKTRNVFWAVQIMKLPIVHSSPVLRYFVHLRAKHRNIFWKYSAFLYLTLVEYFRTNGFAEGYMKVTVDYVEIFI
jgi:hypothetical protein